MAFCGSANSNADLTKSITVIVWSLINLSPSTFISHFYHLVEYLVALLSSPSRLLKWIFTWLILQFVVRPLTHEMWPGYYEYRVVKLSLVPLDIVTNLSKFVTTSIRIEVLGQKQDDIEHMPWNQVIYSDNFC